VFFGLGPITSTLTLMHDTPDITGANYEGGFTWLHTLVTAILFLYSERIQHRSKTVA